MSKFELAGDHQIGEKPQITREYRLLSCEESMYVFQLDTNYTMKDTEWLFIENIEGVDYVRQTSKYHAKIKIGDLFEIDPISKMLVNELNKIRDQKIDNENLEGEKKEKTFEEILSQPLPPFRPGDIMSQPLPRVPPLWPGGSTGDSIGDNLRTYIQSRSDMQPRRYDNGDIVTPDHSLIYDVLTNSVLDHSDTTITSEATLNAESSGVADIIREQTEQSFVDDIDSLDWER